MTQSTTQQFLRFAVIGTFAFVVDTAVLYLVREFLGLYAGRLLSFLVAVTFTWAMNRRFTFRDAADEPRLRQWFRFATANGIGAAVNYATYATLVAVVPAVAAMPVLGVAAGSIMGLGFNFTASKSWVFRG